ncbi:putative reverse transcriptase domain-containing protein [Tanacetum coccineum]
MGIPLDNVGEIPDVDLYEEVAQQGQAEDQPYAEDASPTAESHGYIADSNPMEDDTNADSIDYPDEPGTDDEDEDPKEDPSEEHEPENEDAKEDESFEVLMRLSRSRRTRLLLYHHHLAESSDVAAARASRGSTIARAADRAEDVGYVRRQESKIFYTQLHDARTDCRDIRLEIDVVRGQRTAYETELQETYMSRMEWQRQRVEDDAVRQIMRTQMLEGRARIDTMEDASRGGIKRPVQPTRVCSYLDFLKCQPLNFKGVEGVVGLSQWIEKMESVFHINGCAIENQVKFATCTLLGVALTWWNGYVTTLGHDAAYAMTWGTFKKKLIDKYCPNGEIKKLEIELWNLKVRGNDVATYTQRFQELALMCTKFLADETAKIDKYIGGLPDTIHENVMFARPKTLDFAIELANDLMDQKLRTYAERAE